MKTIDQILNEWYPTIPDEEHNGLYARDKVKLIAQEFADQFRQPLVSGELNCKHDWLVDMYDHFGFPASMFCDKCNTRKAI